MATLAATGFHGNSDELSPSSRREGLFPHSPHQSEPLVVPAARNTGGPSESGGYERSVYQPSRKSGPVALAASAGTVLAMVAGLLTLNVVAKHQRLPHLTVLSMRELDAKPKASPPPKHLEKPVEKPQPVFVPKPKIQLPAPGPVKLAIDVPPPVQLPNIAAPASDLTDASAPAEPSSSAAPQEGGDLSGKALFIKPPVYPVEARRRHEQGTVKLLVLVGVDGHVADIAIASSSGSPALDRAALRAVKRWRWAPSTRNGAAAAVRGYVTIPFVLVSHKS